MQEEFLRKNLYKKFYTTIYTKNLRKKLYRNLIYLFGEESFFSVDRFHKYQCVKNLYIHK